MPIKLTQKQKYRNALRALREIAAGPIDYNGMEECENGAMCERIAREALAKMGVPDAK